MHGWFLVETLLPDGQHTVVADGAKPKQWASLRRVRGELGSAVSDAIQVLVGDCVRDRQEHEQYVRGARGRDQLRVVGVPVFGPQQQVYGVQMWVGPDAVAPPPGRVAAFDWDVDKKVAQVTPEFGRYTGLEGDRATRSAPELFSRVERFDNRLEYFAMLVDFAVGSHWQGILAFRGNAGELRTYALSARTYVEGTNRRVRNLVHDVSESIAPQQHLDLANVRAIAAGSDGVGLVGLDFGVIYNWVSPPAAPLDRWITEQAEFDNPEQFVAACRQLRDRVAERRSLGLRVRFDDSEWFDIDVTLTVATFGPPAQGVIQVRLSA